MTEDARTLLEKMCRLTAIVPAGGYDPNIYSVNRMANTLAWTEHRTRLAMRELRANGLAKVSHEGGCDEEGKPWCIHGWSITRKAKESSQYKEIEKEAVLEYERWSREFEEEWLQEEVERIGNR